MCNSIGQYILDNYGDMSIWSNKNKVNPFEMSRCSSMRIYLNCKDCNSTKSIICSSFVAYGLGCRCGDGQSYPNKMVTFLLSSLKFEFETEKIFQWATDKRYDHYVASLNCIIENHGLQHYSDTSSFKTYGGKTLEEEQKNDIYKEKLARENGIEHYIVLDCRKSDLEWIKNSIMNSKLPDLLGLKENDVDWIKCHEYATKNIVKEACDLWNSGLFETTRYLAQHLRLDKSTVVKYLKQGVQLKWCDYNPIHEEIKVRNNNSIMNGIKRQRKVSIIKDNDTIATFDSVKDLECNAEDLVGVKLLSSKISLVANGKKPQYKGFTFRYEEWDIKK